MSTFYNILQNHHEPDTHQKNHATSMKKLDFVSAAPQSPDGFGNLEYALRTCNDTIELHRFDSILIANYTYIIPENARSFVAPSTYSPRFSRNEFSDL